MRWPWVPRWMYDKTVEMLTEERDAWMSLADDVVSKYHELANPHVSTLTPASHSPHQEPSFVATIIRDQSKHDPRLAAYLKHYATQLKADGMTEDEIGMALTQWTTTEPLES